jgi:DNA-binding NtrC family response regulator
MGTCALITVLVVDDEALIRMYAVDVLEDAGFKAIEAEDGEAALDALDRHPEIGVVFTDIHMPGPFDGLVLARKVHERRPDIQLIIASGRGRPTRDELPRGGTFFMKPYDATEIARLISVTDKVSRSG